MADPLSIAASITALLQLTSVVAQYIGDVKNSSKERIRIRDEISSTSFLLYTLRDRVDAARLQNPQPANDRFSDDSEYRQWLFTVESLTAPRGPLDQFKDALEDLATRLAPAHGHHKIGQAVKWKFEKEEVFRILDTIERQKSIFGLALQNDHVALSNAIKQDIKRLQCDINDVSHGLETISHGVQSLQAYHDEIAEKTRLEKLYSWIGAVDPTSNHEAACKKRHPTTGGWVIEGQILGRWSTTLGSFLWINGIPGCGKTIPCSTIIESILRLCDEGPSKQVAYFYFDFNDGEKQHPRNLINSIIKQLALWSDFAQVLLTGRYSRCNTGEQKLDEFAAKELLHDILAAIIQQSQVYIIIDALDECTDQEEVCSLLETIHGWADSKVNILATSRPEKLIQDALTPLINHKISLRGDVVDADIKRYIQETLQQDAKLSKWPPRVKAEIEEELMNNADGMFRWVFCQLVELRRCWKLDKLRKALRNQQSYNEKGHGIKLTELKMQG